MDQIVRVALDLSEKSDNVYELVYDISKLAKSMIDEQIQKKQHDEFGYENEQTYNSSLKKEKPVQHAIMVKASESDEGGLVG